MLAATYLVAFFFILLLEFTRKKLHKIDFLTLFNIFYILLYLMPMFMFASGIVRPEANMRYIEYKYDTNFPILIAILLTYLMVFFGFYAKNATKIANRIQLSHIGDKKILAIATFFLLVAVGSIYIFGSQFGGVHIALANANLIRNGAVEGGTLSFFKRFVYFSFASSYLFASYFFIKKTNRGKIPVGLLLLISLFVSLIASLIVAARSTMIASFSIFYLVYVVKTQKWHFKFLVPMIISTIFVILYGKAFFFSLTGLPDGYHGVVNKFTETIRVKESSNYSFYDLVNTFAYPVQSLYAAFNEHYEMRLLNDWFYGILSFLPDKLLDIEAQPTMSYFNTQYLVNTSKYDIPTGHIAACIYSFSWPGLVIFSFAYGWIGRYLQTMMQSHLNDIYWMPFIYILTAKVWSDLLTYGDPQTFLQTDFCFLVVIGLLIFMSKKKTR